MTLLEFAHNEMVLAGMYDVDADYGPQLAQCIFDTVKAFSTYGHSGGSAMTAVDVLTKLLRYEPLTPITYETDQWIDQSEASGVPFWQHKRDMKVFSEDAGETHWRLDD